MRHGAKKKQCSIEECTNKAVQGGVCRRHGAKVEIKLCSYEGCVNQVINNGVCISHGAKRKKRCSQEGCTNQAKRRGVCKRHGAYRNANDESTAFGSEFEQTTAARSQTNERANESSIMGQSVTKGVPGEVAILCQEILEV